MMTLGERRERRSVTQVFRRCRSVRVRSAGPNIWKCASHDLGGRGRRVVVRSGDSTALSFIAGHRPLLTVRAAEFQDGAKPPVLIALELFSLSCPSKPLLLGVKAEGR
jgi:hypothetical protein